MSAIIRTERVRQLLSQWIGAKLAGELPIAEAAAQVLRAYVPRKTPLAQIARQLEDVLFRGLYAALGRGMTVQLDNGVLRRIRMDELPEMADDVLLALLEAMDVYAVSYGILREYAMETGSRSALAVLYARYGSFQTTEELTWLARVLRERYPAARPDWLQLPG